MTQEPRPYNDGQPRRAFRRPPHFAATGHPMESRTAPGHLPGPKRTNVSDGELLSSVDDLAAARGGDDEAARRLVAVHGVAMVRVARRVLGSTFAADADDVLQESFVAALTTAALPNGDVGAWLRAITVRKALDLVRQRNRRGEVPMPEPGSAREPSSAPTAPGRVDVSTVRRALEGLSPSDRALLVLVDLEGHSMAEAAAVLGTNRVAAKMRAMRARRKLALLLGAVDRERDGKGELS